MADSTTAFIPKISQTMFFAGKNLVLDGISVCTGPLHWKTKEWCVTGAITAATVGLYLNDAEIKNWAQRNRNELSNNVSFTFGQAGEGFVVIPALGIWWAGAAIYKNPKAQTCARLCLESMLISGAITQTIKLTTHRHRPYSNDRYDTWDGPRLSLEDRSFPSGHATTAFAWATVVAQTYPESFFLGAAVYSVAALTALSRINDNQHWASDVLVGGAIGWATATTLVKLHSQNQNQHVMIIPTARAKSLGLLLACHF